MSYTIGGIPGTITTPTTGDLFEGEQAGVSGKVTLATLMAFILASPTITGTPVAPTQTAGDNSTKLATTAYVATAVTNALVGLLKFQGSTNCSANPNYPAALKGDSYVVTVAGKIGGASGIAVDVGDVYAASADNAGGTQASVGASWFILEHNLVGALLAANNGSDIPSPSTFKTNLGFAAIATSGSGADLTAATVPLTAHTTQAANTLVGNNTGSAASPIALTVAQVQTLLGLVIGTNVQAYSAMLTTLAAEGDPEVFHRFTAYDDCMSVASAAGHVRHVAVGTGASWGVGTTSGFNAAGCLNGAMGTATATSLYIGTNNTSAISFGAGRTQWKNRMRFAVLSDGTNTYTVWNGFNETLTGSPTRGIFFRYTDSVNSGKWQCVTRSAGTETATDSGITAAVDGSHHDFWIDVNAAGTSVDFYIDGVKVATNTTNIPTGSGKECAYAWNLAKTAGTAAVTSCSVDMVYCQVDFTTPR